MQSSYLYLFQMERVAKWTGIAEDNFLFCTGNKSWETNHLPKRLLVLPLQKMEVLLQVRCQVIKDG